MHAHVRVCALHVRPAAERVAEAVAHRVLDLERGELQALERALLRRDIDADRAFDGKVARPVDGLGGGVDVVLAGVGELADAPEDPRGYARPQVRLVGDVPTTAESYASGYATQILRSQGLQLLEQKFLEAARRAGEEGFRTA
jgi:hypothetical protein